MGWRLDRLPLKAHRWVIQGVVFKVGDLLSDFGFLFVTLGAPGDTSSSFYLTYQEKDGGNADTLRTVSLIFCLAGLFLTGPDIYGGYVTKVLDALEEQTTLSLGRAMLCNILSMVLEDFVQLVITLVYIDAIDFGAETGVNQAMTVISVLFAFATLGERLHTTVTLARRGVGPALLGSADGPVFGGQPSA